MKPLLVDRCRMTPSTARRSDGKGKLTCLRPCKVLHERGSGQLGVRGAKGHRVTSLRTRCHPPPPICAPEGLRRVLRRLRDRARQLGSPPNGFVPNQPRVRRAWLATAASGARLQVTLGDVVLGIQLPIIRRPPVPVMPTRPTSCAAVGPALTSSLKLLSTIRVEQVSGLCPQRPNASP